MLEGMEKTVVTILVVQFLERIAGILRESPQRIIKVEEQILICHAYMD